MITLKEFMATEKPKRRSKLEPFKNDIFTLRNEGYSEVSIVKYLAMNGVSISQRGLNLFIQNNTDTKTALNAEPIKKKYEEKKLNTVSSGAEPRKFDWQTPVDESEMI